MKRNLLKICAVIFALVLTLGMSSAVFATDMGTGGTAGSLDNPAGNSVTLKKAIKVINHDGITVGSDSGQAYAPTVTYTYTLSSGSAGGTVTNGNTTVNYKPGIVGGESSYLASTSAAVQTAEFLKTEHAASESSITKDITWTFDPAKFPSAGVYRFVVTETFEGTLTGPSAIGIDRPEGYDTTKFLDVYVQNKNNALVIYGYALVNEEAEAVTTDSAKSQGWNAETDLDVYETYNVTVKKIIAGTGADMTAMFPFTINIAGALDRANISLAGTGNSSMTGTSAIDVSSSLGNGQTVIIQGLPKTSQYDVMEGNETPDAYTVSASVTNLTPGGIPVEDNPTLPGNTDKPIKIVTGCNMDQAEGAVTIEVTNTLNAISPTNVIMRFAPFLFIFGAAILLLVVMRRRRTHDAE